MDFRLPHFPRQLPGIPNQSKVTINLRLLKIEGKSTQTRFLGLSLRFCVIPLLGFKIQISTAKLESCDEKPCSSVPKCSLHQEASCIDAQW